MWMSFAPTIIPPRDSRDGDGRKLEVIKDKTNDWKVGIYNHSKDVALQHYFNYVKIAFGMQQFFCTWAGKNRCRLCSSNNLDAIPICAMEVFRLGVDAKNGLFLNFWTSWNEESLGKSPVGRAALEGKFACPLFRLVFMFTKGYIVEIMFMQ